MMPTEGWYRCTEISAKEFKSIFNYTKGHGELVSSIAYPEINDVVGKHLGIDIPIDKAKGLTILDDESDILVIRLKFRIKADRKGHRLGSKFEDYAFYHIKKYPLEWNC